MAATAQLPVAPAQPCRVQPLPPSHAIPINGGQAQQPGGVLARRDGALESMARPDAQTACGSALRQATQRSQRLVRHAHAPIRCRCPPCRRLWVARPQQRLPPTAGAQRRPAALLGWLGSKGEMQRTTRRPLNTAPSAGACAATRTAAAAAILGTSASGRCWAFGGPSPPRKPRSGPLQAPPGAQGWQRAPDGRPAGADPRQQPHRAALACTEPVRAMLP